MENQSIREENFGWFKRNAIPIGVVWTLVLAGLLGWSLREYKTHLLEPIMVTDVSHWWSIAYIYGVIWLLGLLGIVFTFISFGKYFRELEAQKTLLQQSRDYFKAFYQQAPVAFQLLAGDGTVLEVNKTWLLLLGYQVDEVIGKDFAAFLAPESEKEFRRLFAQFKTAGQVKGALLELRHYNGNIIKGSFYGRVERDEQGNFKRTICVFYDITKNIEQQEIIARLQQRNETILMATGEGIIGLDEKRKVMFVNPAAAEMLGYAPEELLGQDSHETWHRHEKEIDSSGRNVCRICLAMETLKGKKTGYR